MLAECQLQKNHSAKVNHCCCCCYFFPRRAFYICLTSQVIGFTIVLILPFTVLNMHFNFVSHFVFPHIYFSFQPTTSFSWMTSSYTTDCPLLQCSSTFLIVRNGRHIFVEIQKISSKSLFTIVGFIYEWHTFFFWGQDLIIYLLLDYFYIMFVWCLLCAGRYKYLTCIILFIHYEEGTIITLVLARILRFQEVK